MKIDTDYIYKKEYEDAVAWAEATDLPKWEELSDEQRENIRIQVRKKNKWFNELGDAIAKGEPLPDPLE